MTRRRIRKSPEALAARAARRKAESDQFLKAWNEHRANYMNECMEHMIKTLQKIPLTDASGQTYNGIPIHPKPLA